MDSDELKAKASEIFNIIVQLETDKYRLLKCYPLWCHISHSILPDSMVLVDFCLSHYFDDRLFGQDFCSDVLLTGLGHLPGLHGGQHLPGAGGFFCQEAIERQTVS